MAGQPQGAEAAADHDHGLPRQFGRYLLFDRIGSGGMAEIFLARADLALGASRHVVVKQVLPQLTDDAGFARMLTAEAKLAAQLAHQNIVQVLDLGEDDGRLFIAMEYVEGFDLNQLLRRLSEKRVPLPAEFALFMVREIVAALAYAHRATDASGAPLGVVHRDVSPSNVLISFEGEVKLCDFGIARALGRDVDERPSGAPAESPEAFAEQEASRVGRARVAGKSAYMAPEHARGDEIDARADLFAAGILLWELCAGRRLYKGSEVEMLAQARRGVVLPLPDRGLPKHDDLQAVLSRALAADPGARYFRAEDFLKDLDAYALANGLMASQLRFGAFLMEQFGEDIVAVRRARESAAEQKLRASGPPVGIAAAAIKPSATQPVFQSNAQEQRTSQSTVIGSEAVSHVHGAMSVDARTATKVYYWVTAAGLVLGAALAWMWLS